MSSTKWQDCKPRIYRALALWLGLPFLGALYGLWVSHTGFGIPCLFYAVTGLKCPGCGITHMALCLMHGDLGGAYSKNPMVLMLLPVLLALLLRLTFRYVKTGSRQLTTWENRIVIGMVILLIGFGVLRNLKFFA